MYACAELTLAAVPAKAPRDVCGLDGTLLAGLQQDKESLQLVGDTGDWVLLRVYLKLPTTEGGRERKRVSELECFRSFLKK